MHIDQALREANREKAIKYCEESRLKVFAPVVTPKKLGTSWHLRMMQFLFGRWFVMRQYDREN